MNYYGIKLHGRKLSAEYETREEAQAQVDAFRERYAEKADTAAVFLKAVVPSTLYVTTAPEAYDGFGTRTHHVNRDGSRIVDVQDRHSNWQRGRYASGMYRMDVFGFMVHYEIVTEESAENGDAEERGTIGQFEFLRDALEALCSTRTSRVGGITDTHCDRWIAVCNGMEFETGAYESRSLHFPKGTSQESINRAYRVYFGEVAA